MTRDQKYHVYVPDTCAAVILINRHRHCSITSTTMNMNPTQNDTADDMPLPSSSTWTIPPGYTVGQSPDGHDYLVPKFLLSATDLALKTRIIKDEVDVMHGKGGVSFSLTFNRHCPPYNWCRCRCRCRMLTLNSLCLWRTYPTALFTKAV
jgi:hypothetical protein